MLVYPSRLINPQGSGTISPATIFGSSLVGWFQMGNAGVGVADNSFRTLDTSASENNVSVLKNQVSGQPNLEQATKVSMPRIQAADINSMDAVNLDVGNSNINMLSTNTVSGTGSSLLTFIILKTVSLPISYSRILGVARDSGFDGDANGALCPTGSSAGTGLAVYTGSADRGSATFSTGTYRIVTTILDATSDTITCRSAKSVLFGPNAWTGALNFNKFLLGVNNLGAASNAAFMTPEFGYVSRTGAFTQAEIDAIENYLGARYGL